MLEKKRKENQIWLIGGIPILSEFPPCRDTSRGEILLMRDVDWAGATINDVKTP
jgi:hypothetical protein